jgi:hypothetical protein
LEVAEVSMARLTVFLARLIGLFTILLVPTLLVHCEISPEVKASIDGHADRRSSGLN